MNYKKKWLELVLLALFLPCLSVAEEAAHHQIPKLTANIALDGILNESAWESASKIELRIETEPAENQVAKVKTSAYVFEDGDFLYLGFKAEDPAIDSLRASFRDRDNILDEDRVGIKIDTFDDERRTYNFFVNPLGIQLDSISDDVHDVEDLSWNSIWYSAGKVTETGYSVELKIPFKVLRFPETDGKKQWAIDLVRYMPKEFNYRFAASPVDRNINCTICQYAKLQGFEGIQSGNNIELVPYVSASQSDSRDLATSTEWDSGSLDEDAGLDLRWSIDDSSVLSLTANPDFSQVESDAAQLAVNTRFALFFDEKRPFFLEGADYFNTQLTIFYSRNIADPDWGAKYTGKHNNGSLGVLVSRDQNTNLLLPSSQSTSLVDLQRESNVAAFRYGYDLNDDTVLGFAMTHRSADDYENNLFSFDGKHQLTDTDLFRYHLIYTQTQNPQELQDFFGRKADETGNAYRLNYSHNDRDWSWFLSHNHFDQDFRADLGFLTRSGYRKSIAGLGHRWYGGDDAIFSKIELRSDWDTSVQHDGQKLETELEATLTLTGRNQSDIQFHAGNRDVFFDNQWFVQDFYDISASFKPTASLRLGLIGLYSDDIDFLSSTARAGQVSSYGGFAYWQFNQHFNLEFEFEQQSFDLDVGNFFDESIANTKLIYQFNEKSYLRLLLRYSDTDFTNDASLLQGLNVSLKNKKLARQLLYTYKFDAKSVFYLGYSDGSVSNDTIDKLKPNQRTLFAKFSYAFQL